MILAVNVTKLAQQTGASSVVLALRKHVDRTKTPVGALKVIGDVTIR